MCVCVCVCVCVTVRACVSGSSWSHANCANVYGGQGFVNNTFILCKELRTYPFGVVRFA